jgi:hypothetical protein
MDGQAEQPSHRLPLAAELAVMEAPMKLTEPWPVIENNARGRIGIGKTATFTPLSQRRQLCR